MFGQLADPHGANNALSQVLYGLALRSVVVISSQERAQLQLSQANSYQAWLGHSKGRGSRSYLPVIRSIK